MKKRILLIEPRNELVFSGGSSSPPLWPCALSALTPKSHTVEFIDCCFENVTKEKLCSYDLIGITCRTDSANHAYLLGDWCKRLKIPCVIGGIHAFFLSEEAREHCDSVVLGEAECLGIRLSKMPLKKNYGIPTGANIPNIMSCHFSI